MHFMALMALHGIVYGIMRLCKAPETTRVIALLVREFGTIRKGVNSCANSCIMPASVPKRGGSESGDDRCDDSITIASDAAEDLMMMLSMVVGLHHHHHHHHHGLSYQHVLNVLCFYVGITS